MQPITKEQIEKARRAKMSAEAMPDLPDGRLLVPAEDKPLIRELGKEMMSFLYNYAQTKGKLPSVVIIGAFEYVVDIMNQRNNLITQNVSQELLSAIDAIEKKGLSELINEPFQDAPVEPETPPTAPETPSEATPEDVAAIEKAAQ